MQMCIRMFVRYAGVIAVASLAVATPSAAGEHDYAAAQPAAGCEGQQPNVGNPYKGVFFENDFGYLNDPCLEANDPRDFWSRITDKTKRREIAPQVTLDLGGEYRLRYHDEDNFARNQLNGLDNTFLLSRLRVFANLEVTD